MIFQLLRGFQFEKLLVVYYLCSICSHILCHTYIYITWIYSPGVNVLWVPTPPREKAKSPKGKVASKALESRRQGKDHNYPRDLHMHMHNGVRESGICHWLLVHLLWLPRQIVILTLTWDLALHCYWIGWDVMLASKPSGKSDLQSPPGNYASGHTKSTDKKDEVDHSTAPCPISPYPTLE